MVTNTDRLLLYPHSFPRPCCLYPVPSVISTLSPWPTSGQNPCLISPGSSPGGLRWVWSSLSHILPSHGEPVLQCLRVWLLSLCSLTLPLWIVFLKSSTLMAQSFDRQVAVSCYVCCASVSVHRAIGISGYRHHLQQVLPVLFYPSYQMAFCFLFPPSFSSRLPES